MVQDGDSVNVVGSHTSTLDKLGRGLVGDGVDLTSKLAQHLSLSCHHVMLAWRHSTCSASLLDQVTHGHSLDTIDFLSGTKVR